MPLVWREGKTDDFGSLHKAIHPTLKINRIPYRQDFEEVFLIL